MDGLKTFANRRIKQIIALACLGIQILLGVIFVFTCLKDELNDSNAFYNIFDSDYSIYYGSTVDIVFSCITMAADLAFLIISAIGVFKAITRKKMLFLEAGAFAMGVSMILFGALSNLISVIIPVIVMLISGLLFGYLFFFYKVNKEEAKIEAERANDASIPEAKEKDINIRRGVLPAIITMFVGLVATFLIFVLPVCIFEDETVFKLFDVFSSDNDPSLPFKEDFQLPLVTLISFSIFFFAYVWLILDTSKALSYSRNNANKFYKLARRNIYSSFAITICYFVFSIGIEFFLYKQLEISGPISTSNISFIPLIAMAVVVIVHSILTSRYTKDDNKIVHRKKVNRLITLAFTIAFVGLLVACTLSRIIRIEYSGNFDVTGEPVWDVYGFDLLKDAKEIDPAASHLQLFSFLIYVALIIAAVVIVVSVSTFIRGSKFFYKASLISVISCFIGIVAISLFSKYFAIAEEVNKEIIKKVLEHYVPSLASVDFETTVTSDSVIYLFIGLGLFGLLSIFRPYSQQIKEEGLDVNINDLDELGEALSSAGGGSGGAGGGVGLSREDVAEGKSKDFDSCPAFSEIDGEEAEILEDIEQRRKVLFANPTLPSLVRFIVDYARESRLHLFYKEEDIAQFVAGLGSSKLSILQGMSGTGKTSLPKIFSEAILGNVNIVEVESSWKDKNELLGYFNEFSGKFTPKKFTQSLYRAAFYGDVITFIVLDEMNLSRIEYYFSDFLSLMENEPDKREIKLLNVQLKNFKGGINVSYKQLKKGHTLKVSPNIWFIGTANRDESTFEISDKVYDRAMTMNFMKRAPKIDAYSEPIDQRFLDYPTFNALLEKACNSFKFDCSSDPTVRAVEKLLQPYNISFGNRIERQIEKFVSVYCSCFTDSQKMIPIAVEKILFSKVVAKLEFKSVENKEELAHSFEELGLMECASFINKLNGDL